jgi:toxin HigB-1
MGKFSATLPQAIQKAAARKLEIIDAARDLEDLMTPPGNRLEALSSDRLGQHSIRINEQWRVCLSGKMEMQTMLRSLIITKEAV